MGARGEGRKRRQAIAERHGVLADGLISAY
jgi:hypothetical protein